MLTAVTGINWGDEGKGRIVDLLSEKADVAVRYQGGNNAGHTVVTDAGTFILNLLPSGILHPDVTCVLGTGMVVDLNHLRKEMASLTERGIDIGPRNLKLSDRATICMPFHVLQDELEEARLGSAAFGSTKRGIAYSYGDKFMKKTLRPGDLLRLDASVKARLETILEAKNLVLQNVYGQRQVSFAEVWDWCCRQADFFAPYICDTGTYLQKAAKEGKNILFEAQLGALRDIDYGIYPFTSSSNTIAAYAPVGAGLPGAVLDHTVGVMKAYSTCVGAGPFTAEKAMDAAWMEQLRKAGAEYGAATGRPRRVGPFDAVASRYGIACQNADRIALTKLDVLSSFESIPIVTEYKLGGKPVSEFSPCDDLERAVPQVTEVPGWRCDISACRRWEDLPEAARNYVTLLEKLTGREIGLISVGAARDAYLLKGAWL